MPNYEKRKHQNRIPGIPELTGFAHHHRPHTAEFLPHIHPGDMEIVYIGGGEVKWWAGKNLYNLRGGDVYVTFPDEAHGSLDDLCAPCELYWLTIELATPHNLCGLNKTESDKLRECLQLLPSRHFRASPIFKAIFTHLCTACTAYRSTDEKFNPNELRSLLCTCLWHLVGCSLTPARGSLISEAITHSLRIMEQNLRQPLSLHRISDQTGYSLAHFKDLFRREMGISPGKYYMRRRAFAAAEEISGSDKSLLEIAYDFSFSSSQYLATCIKRETGKTPTQLRKAHE